MTVERPDPPAEKEEARCVNTGPGQRGFDQSPTAPSLSEISSLSRG